MTGQNVRTAGMSSDQYDQLEFLFNYKNHLMEDLLTNERILTMLSDDAATPSDPDAMMYKQVFPYEYVPETVQEGKTFICSDVDVSAPDGTTFLYPTLYVWVFTHRSLLRLPEGGVRTDALCCEIAKTINGSRRYSQGQLNLSGLKRFAPMTDFQGKCMIYRGKDFNHLYNPKRSVPENRKSG